MKHQPVGILLTLTGVIWLAYRSVKAQPGWGYLAVIVEAKSGDQLCTGTFINPLTVITAGRCLFNSRSRRENYTYAVLKYGVNDDTEQQRFMVEVKPARQFGKYKYDFFINDVGFAVSHQPIAVDMKYGKVVIPHDEYKYEKWVSDVVLEEHVCHVPIMPEAPTVTSFANWGLVKSGSLRNESLVTTGKLEMLPVKVIRYGDCVSNLERDLNMVGSDMNIEMLIGVGLVCAKSPDDSQTICSVSYGAPIICGNQREQQLLGVMSLNNCSPYTNISVKMAMFSRSDRVVRDIIGLKKVHLFGVAPATVASSFVCYCCCIVLLSGFTIN